MAKTFAGAAWLMRMLLVALCAAAFLGAVNAADLDPLQDFCVADLSANAPLVNGFPCKPRSTVTSEDFVFRGLGNPRLTSQSPGFLITANQIFQTNITSAVLEKSFGEDAATVKKITASVPDV